jgi:hypothetical protein
MLIRNIAVVSEIDQVSVSDLTTVAAALQQQVTRDFSPLWEIDAIVSGFKSLDDVPLGYWPVIIEADIGMKGAAGVHQDENNQPIALVQYDASWSLTTSHETLEMLADPSGNRLQVGKSLQKDQGQVEYLVEVCDPSEDQQFAYQMNGITVSDFYTPHFFDPVKNSSVMYSFTGAIKEPLQVLVNGYLSWHDPATDTWWQEQYFTGAPVIVDLSANMSKAEGKSLRSRIDSVTRFEGWKSTQQPTLTMAARRPEATKPSASRAKSWRNQIAAIKAKGTQGNSDSPAGGGAPGGTAPGAGGQRKQGGAPDQGRKSKAS